MRVLQIIGSMSIGGAEKLLLDILPLLNVDTDNLKVDLALLDGRDTPFLKELEKKNSCEIHKVSKGSVYNPLLIFRLIPIIRKYDIIHVHLFPAQYFVVFAKVLSLSSGKLIFTEHSTSNRRLESSVFRLFDRFIYSFYQKVICISPAVKQALLNFKVVNSNKLVVIENGVDIARAKGAHKVSRSDFDLQNSDCLLIMVAAFRHQKDQDTIIRTLKLMPLHYKLLLVGDGERRTVLEKMMVIEGVQDRVFFLGVRNDIYSLIKMCDIAILSSHWEGFGLAAVEAMACGVPTVASNVPGLAEVVGEGGILFEKGSEKDLANVLRRLEDTDYYNAIKSKGIRKSEAYDIRNMIKKIMDVYNETFGS